MNKLVVQVEPFGLADDLAVPFQPQPFQVTQDLVGELGSAPGGVDILDPKQKPAAGGPGFFMGDQRGIDMAQMQTPGRARRKPGRHLRFR